MRRMWTAAAAALFVLSGCGTVDHAAEDRAGDVRPSTTRTAVQPSPSGQNGLFRKIAARCADSRPVPSAGGTAEDGGPVDPEAAKYAENHAFQQQMPLKADAECRGKEHAEHVTQALRKSGGVEGRNEAGLRAALEALGYPSDGTQVYRTGDTLGFSLFVPSGPCLTGRLDTVIEIEAHGPYTEGGCTRPRGGH